MATGGYDEREERMKRRELLRMEQERDLEEQGVLLSDEDMPKEKHTHTPAMIGQHEYLLLDENENFSLDLSESEDENDDGDTSPKRTEEVQNRTKQLEEENLRFEERIRELERREQLAIQRGIELEERRIAFEKRIQEYEQKERQAMKKKLHDEMYKKSLQILKDLEDDLSKKTNNRTGESEGSRRERKVHTDGRGQVEESRK